MCLKLLKIYDERMKTLTGELTLLATSRHTPDSAVVWLGSAVAAVAEARRCLYDDAFPIAPGIVVRYGSNDTAEGFTREQTIVSVAPGGEITYASGAMDLSTRLHDLLIAGNAEIVPPAPLASLGEKEG